MLAKKLNSAKKKNKQKWMEKKLNASKKKKQKLKKKCFKFVFFH